MRKVLKLSLRFWQHATERAKLSKNIYLKLNFNSNFRTLTLNLKLNFQNLETRFKILFQNNICLKQMLKFMVAATLGKNLKHNSKNRRKPRAADNMLTFLG